MIFFQLCEIDSIVASDDFIRQSTIVSRMCFAVTYLHASFIEPLIEQIEQVSYSISEIIQTNFLFIIKRFVQVRNGMHVELLLNLFKL